MGSTEQAISFKQKVFSLPVIFSDIAFSVKRQCLSSYFQQSACPTNEYSTNRITCTVLESTKRDEGKSPPLDFDHFDLTRSEKSRNIILQDLVDFSIRKKCIKIDEYTYNNTNSIIKRSTTGTMRLSFIHYLTIIQVPNLAVAFSVQTRQLHRALKHEVNPLFSTTNDNNIITKTKTPVFDEVCETTGVTLKRFMSEVAMLNPELTELTTLFGAIDTACKAISNLVRRSQLPSSGTLGLEGEVNVQGEDQKKLDVITNELLKRALRFSGRLGVLASEEEDTPVDLCTASESSILINDMDKYVAVFDPLDGSSNVDAGIPTGTIIGIYEHDESCYFDLDNVDDGFSEQEAQCLANTLQPGTNLVAAAYCLYSSSTFLVMTLGAGTHGFTLDENLGEFVLSHPNIRIPSSSSIMSFNEANTGYWDKPMQEVAAKWRSGTGKSGKRFSSRYIGSMVGDVHRTLLYGGVFGYPADTKNPNGKLRLLYEGAPMSFIVEQAGGMSTTGTERVMEISPDIVHQRVPVIMGSSDDIQEVIEAYIAWKQ